MLLAQRIALYPTSQQADYLDRACGSRRHAYNQLLAHFGQHGVKWSKRAAFDYFTRVIRPAFPWYDEVSSRVTRNAIDDLDNAFKHFFRRVKLGQKPGFPRFHKKGVNDGFAMREKPKFDVAGRTLRIERLATRIKLRQLPRFTGTHCQVTVSKQAGKFYMSLLTDTQDYARKDEDREAAVGVDFGVKSLATFSTGEAMPANQKLKANLRRLGRKQRRLSRKQRGSNRRAKAKLAVAKLHKRIADQRSAVLHEVSDSADPAVRHHRDRRPRRKEHGQKSHTGAGDLGCRVRRAAPHDRIQGRAARLRGGHCAALLSIVEDLFGVRRHQGHAVTWRADLPVRGLRPRTGPRPERRAEFATSAHVSGGR